MPRFFWALPSTLNAPRSPSAMAPDSAPFWCAAATASAASSYQQNSRPRPPSRSRPRPRRARGLAHDAERHPDVGAADRLGGRAEAAGLEVLLVRVDGRRDDLDAFLQAAHVVDGARRELAGAEPVLNFYGVVGRVDALDGRAAAGRAEDLERSCLCEHEQQE